MKEEDMTIDYATEPADARVYGDKGGLDELLVDTWLLCQLAEPVGPDWTDRDQLRSIPRYLMRIFEQGRNAPPFAFALKSDPTADLADDGCGGCLHYLADDPTDEHYSPAVREFYRPVAAAIEAGVTALAGYDASARSDGPTHHQLLTWAGYRVAEVFFERIAELGVLRAKDFDESTVRATGLDRDIAPALPDAWRAYLAKRH